MPILGVLFPYFRKFRILRRLLGIRISVSIHLFAALGFLLSSSAFSADYTWIPSDSGTWNAANWGGVDPTETDSLAIDNGGTVVMPDGVSGTYHDLRLGVTDGGSGSISISGGELIAPRDIMDFGSGAAFLGYASSSSGSVVMTGGTWDNGATYVGFEGAGSFTLAGGYADSIFVVGQSSNGTGNFGVMAISSGTLSGALAVGDTGGVTVTGGRVTGDISFQGSGTVTVNSGVLEVTSLSDYAETGSFELHGGEVLSGSTDNLSAVVTGGTWNNVSNLSLRELAMSGGEISVSNATVQTGTISGGTWSGGDTKVTEALTIDGGSVLYGNLYVGGDSGSATLTLASGTIGGLLNIGHFGEGSMTMDGGHVSGGIVGSGSGSVTMNGGTWDGVLSIGSDGGTGTFTLHGGQITGNADVGVQGTGLFVVNGGTSSNEYLWIGGAGGHVGTLLLNEGLVTSYETRIGNDGSNSEGVVTGENSVLSSQILSIGGNESGNTLLVQNNALVQVGVLLYVSPWGGTENYLRLDGGYVALYGEQLAAVAGLLAGGNIQLWDNGWVTATEEAGFDFAYFETEGEAYAFSGHSGLGGYTIMTAPQTIPEPEILALILPGAVVLFLNCKRDART